MAAPSRKSILVVDDDQSFLAMMVDRLEAEGFRVTSAEDAAQAVIQAEAFSPAMVIMDVNMPSFGTGIDALAKLREIPKLKDVPVILMTGMSPEGLREVWRGTPHQVWIMYKPPKWDILLSQIRRVLGPTEKPPAA
ncbi:MAG: response regulator [Elusimicrobia bacterium]|nr:response regulator [Elusimicrobiota bacterium]